MLLPLLTHRPVRDRLRQSPCMVAGKSNLAVFGNNHSPALEISRGTRPQGRFVEFVAIWPEGAPTAPASPWLMVVSSVLLHHRNKWRKIVQEATMCRLRPSPALEVHETTRFRRKTPSQGDATFQSRSLLIQALITRTKATEKFALMRGSR
ncbi:hypothetical protein JCGZ_24389 [Jatropha curcas]|uniref:Uncharacterized protein n=1 Tax=Jatropha curcas TaxID=180498 RepID=A0A067LDP8_JATCU|nr:hypothetical protein JCGZ_24389 [Jatropha curcas]